MLTPLRWSQKFDTGHTLLRKQGAVLAGALIVHKSACNSGSQDNQREAAKCKVHAVALSHGFQTLFNVVPDQDVHNKESNGHTRD